MILTMNDITPTGRQKLIDEVLMAVARLTGYHIMATVRGLDMYFLHDADDKHRVIIQKRSYGLDDQMVKFQADLMQYLLDVLPVNADRLWKDVDVLEWATWFKTIEDSLLPLGVPVHMHMNGPEMTAFIGGSDHELLEVDDKRELRRPADVVLRGLVNKIMSLWACKQT